MTRFQRLTLVAMCLPLFVIFVDMTIVYVVLPDVQRQLSAGVDGLQWVLDAFTLMYGSLLLTGGSLGDRYGRRRVFLIGVVTFTVGSVVCAASPTLAVLIAGRALQGIGAALAFPTSLSLLTLAFPEPRERARAIGIWVAASAAALAIGPLIGGLLVGQFGWRSVFLINVPICLAACALTVAIRAPEPRRDTGRLDVPGQILVFTGLSALAFAAIEGDRHGWTSALIVGAIAVAVLALAGFVALQARGTGRMLDLSYFRISRYALANLLGALAYFGLFGVILLLSLLLQRIDGHSALAAGVRFLPLTVAVAIAALAAGSLAGRFDTRLLMSIGALLMGAGLLGVTGMGPHEGFASYGWILAVLGIGTGLVTTPGTVAVISAVPAEDSGTASGVVASFRLMGSSLGVAVLGSLAAHRFDDRLAALGGHRAGDLAHLAAAPVRTAGTQGSAMMSLVGHAFESGLHLAAAVGAALLAGGALVGLATVALSRLRRASAAALPGPVRAPAGVALADEPEPLP